MKQSGIRIYKRVAIFLCALCIFVGICIVVLYVRYSYEKQLYERDWSGFIYDNEENVIQSFEPAKEADASTNESMQEYLIKIGMDSRVVETMKARELSRYVSAEKIDVKTSYLSFDEKGHSYSVSPEKVSNDGFMCIEKKDFLITVSNNNYTLLTTVEWVNAVQWDLKFEFALGAYQASCTAGSIRTKYYFKDQDKQIDLSKNARFASYYRSGYMGPRMVGVLNGDYLDGALLCMQYDFCRSSENDELNTITMFNCKRVYLLRNEGINACE